MAIGFNPQPLAGRTDYRSRQQANTVSGNPNLANNVSFGGYRGPLKPESMMQGTKPMPNAPSMGGGTVGARGGSMPGFSGTPPWQAVLTGQYAQQDQQVPPDMSGLQAAIGSSNQAGIPMDYLNNLRSQMGQNQYGGNWYGGPQNNQMLNQWWGNQVSGVGRYQPPMFSNMRTNEWIGGNNPYRYNLPNNFGG